MSTPLPAIANLLKTSSSLKHTSLVLPCYFNNFQKLPIDLATWVPLIHLLTETSASSIKLRINIWDEIVRPRVLTSLAKCADLMVLVDKGVLVITPEIPGERKVSQCAS